MKRVAINGFGRIGRLFLRQAWGHPDIEVVAINDLGDGENLAYLLRHDTVYHAFEHEIGFVKDTSGVGGFLTIDSKRIAVLQEREVAKLPWKQMDIDVVVESTGMFESFEKASAHVGVAGARHVVITAPAKDGEGVSGGKTILMGINHDEAQHCPVTSNGSCTTNATAPVVAIMDEEFGVSKAALSTIHAYTATQSLTDAPTKGHDFRRGRAAAQNIVPSTTGAAIAITRVLPNLEGRFDGIALRVPTITGSLDDITFVIKRKTTVAEVNEAFRKAASSSRWRGILGVDSDQPVSGDIIGTAFATLVDLEYTKVIDGDLVKVLAWYDNEWGYVTTLIKHVIAAS